PCEGMTGPLLRRSARRDMSWTVTRAPHVVAVRAVVAGQGGVSFDRPRGHAARHVALREAQQAGRGDGGDDGGGYAGVPLGGAVADVVVAAQGGGDEPPGPVGGGGAHEARPRPQERKQ